MKKILGIMTICLIALAAWAGLNDASQTLPAEVPDAQNALHGRIPGDLPTMTNVEEVVGAIVTNLVWQKYRSEDLRNCFWNPSARIFYKGEIKRIDGEDRMFYIAITNVNLFVVGVPDELK